jgi:hypothetical protein
MNNPKLAHTNHTVDSVVPLPTDKDIWFEQEFNMERWQADRAPSMPIVVTKGTLDWAYPPFILASTTHCHPRSDTSCEPSPQAIVFKSCLTGPSNTDRLCSVSGHTPT